MRPIDETIEDIRQQAQFYQGKKINSCFLQDGDALVLKTDYLLRILDAINQYFCLLYIPCAAALATIRKESGSTRWMLLSALFQLIVAWVVTFIVYRIGLFI